MRLRTFALLGTFGFGACCLATNSRADDPSSESSSGSVIVREMNFARQNPVVYASYIEELRGHFQGTLLVLPGRAPFRTKEGTRALDEAIQFLRRTPPQAPFVYSPGMSRAAADHVADQAGGGMSHKGRDWSNTADRINRYGMWSGAWGENLSCGRRGARETVIALIVDDGLRSRKHRHNIFNPSFNYSGAAVGPHAQYHTICSIEFAGGYVERGPVAEAAATALRGKKRRPNDVARETLFATNGS